MDPLLDYYCNKNVLITGATGFVGKMILWKLLQSASVINKVYVLIRPKRIPAGSPSQRLLDEIVNTPIFQSLEDSKLKLRQKLIPISYDLSLPHMGLSLEDGMQMKDTNIVIHCAATSEYENSLEWNIETNVLGTLRLMDYVEGCIDICAFVHLSHSHIYQDIPNGCEDMNILEYVYDLGFGDPEDFLKDILKADQKESINIARRILQKYPTLHLFTKALIEHLIIRRIDQVRAEERLGGKEPYPLIIFRSNHIGPSAIEPVPGMTSGLSGLSSWLALYGHSIPVVQPDQGKKLINVNPVDYVATSIVHCIPKLEYPGSDFILPLISIANSVVLPKMPPIRSNRNSTSSFDSIASISTHTASSSRQSTQVKFFPYICHISVNATSTPPITWYEAYSAIRDYWSRPNNSLAQHQPLPLAKDYFSANKTISKARFLMRYYFKTTAQPPPPPTRNNRVSMISNMSPIYNQTMTGHHDQKWMELASNIRNSLGRQSRYDWTYSHTRFKELLPVSMEKYRDIDWYNYFLQSCYGVQLYCMHSGTHLRSSVLLPNIECALYSSVKKNLLTGHEATIIDAPMQSVIYTEDEMKQRIEHMIEITIQSLRDPQQSLLEEKVWKPLWIVYLDDALEDWCDERLVNINSMKIQMRWKLQIDDHKESLKINILNNPRVGTAIQQISKRSGMPSDKVMTEAVKSLQRIQERSHLSYVCFAASFLQRVFKSMFSGIHINTSDLNKIRNSVRGKQVVYIPVSKTALDPILIWFLCIRYDLPIPALILDEALAIVGPFSDILRLAGAVFIKRDPQLRSPLTTAVTSAYIKHLLEEKGALTLVLEQVRSRAGTQQEAYKDGLLEMIVLDQEVDKDIVFIPMNITYEEVPDISLLVEQDLYTSVKKSRSSELSRTPSQRMSTPSKVSRPSDSRAQRVRSRSLGNGQYEEKSTSSVQVPQCGRLLVGVGQPISLSQHDKNDVIKQLTDTIQREQSKCIIVSPVSLVASILLYSRNTNTMRGYLDYLYHNIKLKGIPIDWHESEDIDNIIFYSVRLLEKSSNIVSIDDRTNQAVFRICTRSESILQLAYHSNQLRDIFILDSIFAVIYLSFGVRVKVIEEVFIERFEFLAKLLQHHFSISWDIIKEYNVKKAQYMKDSILSTCKDEHMIERLVINSVGETKNEEYNQISLMASFIYPIIDSIWVMLCSLSILNDCKAFPLSLIPTLSHWVGMHLIRGKRTIYSEVLSTEYCHNALRSILYLGLIDKKSAKLVLSPDAQMVLQALGISTNDELVLKSSEYNINEENEDDETVKSSETSDSIAELCRKLEQLRTKETDGSMGFLHTYERCQNQINSLARTDNQPSYSKKQGAMLSDKSEEIMIQLGYSLIQNTSK
ncbi:male sterility protein-domain-containing protein [Pilobolus umbonatus]|nr:male sterility protein-domain-containing protein [Pilobolus umbonatus]